jgi:alpha-tubulin suppressor-like RCC1 family protein
MKKIIFVLMFTVLGVLSACTTTPEEEISNEYVSLQAGYHHAVALDQEGNVFTWGSSFYGVLGNGVSDIDEMETTPINITENFDLEDGEMIVKIVVGDYTNFAITNTSRVFVWGWNVLGQLGVNNQEIISEPLEITERLNLSDNETVTQISTKSHTLILTSTSRVIAFGNNADGQLGLGDSTDQTRTMYASTPVDITKNFPLLPNETIDYVHVGNEGFSLTITSLNRVLYFGRVTQYDRIETPSEVGVNLNLNSEESITSLYEGDYPALLSSEGRIFYLFRSISFPSPFVEINGIELSNALNLDDNDSVLNMVLGYRSNGVVITESGQVIPFGDNRNERLGFESSTDMIVPPFVKSSQTYTSVHEALSLEDGETVLSVSLGNHFITLVTSENRIFTWGINNLGVLGNGTTDNQTRPTEIQLP